ncbi:MAG: hypothetical protein WBF99_23610 [Xanthobacteraceae bacterium]|nr:hypothetical protein [Hyphomicrobiales bacterium]MBN8983287.1 hypothetical protein [Hyphomicrobiales bacterium]
MSIRSLIVPLTVAALLGVAGPVYAQGAFPAPLPAGITPAEKPSPFPPVNNNNGGVIKNDPAFPPVNGAAANSPFPPVNGAPRASLSGPSPFPSNGAPPVAGAGAFGGPQGGPPPGAEDCMKEFMPLRKEAERRGKLIKAASDRRAPAAEACKLIGNFSQAEVKMIKYVHANQQKCGIPAQVSDQLKDGHKNTEKMLKQVCNVAHQQAQQPRGPSGPSLADVLGSSASMPTPTHGSKKGGSTFDTLSGNVLTR